jgi:hypothetical protein
VTVEVNRHHGPNGGIRRQHRPAQIQVKQSVLVHVNEDWHGAGAQNGQRGRECAHGRGEHLAAGRDARGPQPYLDGIEATGAADDLRAPHARGQAPLEVRDFVSKHVPAALAHAPDRIEDRLSGIRPLALEIVQKDLSFSQGLRACFAGSAPFSGRLYHANPLPFER